MRVSGGKIGEFDAGIADDDDLEANFTCGSHTER